jgi:hypothetical protein
VSPTALGSITLCRVLVMALRYPLLTCAARPTLGCRHRERATLADDDRAASGFNGVGLALVVPGWQTAATTPRATPRSGGCRWHSAWLPARAHNQLPRCPRLVIFAGRRPPAQQHEDLGHICRPSSRSWGRANVLDHRGAGGVRGHAAGGTQLHRHVAGRSSRGVHAPGDHAADEPEQPRVPCSRRFPNTGRVALAQVSTASTVAVPFAAVLLLAFFLDIVMPWSSVSTI